MRASEAPCSSKIWVHKYHSVRHDQREPSAVSAHDEDETDAGVRRPARHEARLYHQEHQRSAIGAPPRPSINMPRLRSAVLRGVQKSGNAYLLNGLQDARRTKNRDCNAPGGSPHFWSDTVNLKGTASANSFAASVLLFSEKHRSRRTVAATRRGGTVGHGRLGRRPTRLKAFFAFVSFWASCGCNRPVQLS